MSSTSSIELVAMDVDPPPPPLSPMSPIHDFIPLEPELLEPLPPLPPTLTASGQPYCEHRLPRRLTDDIPEALASAPLPHESQPETGATGSVCHVLLIVWDKLVTTANSFGVWHDYPCYPTICYNFKLLSDNCLYSCSVLGKLSIVNSRCTWF